MFDEREAADRRPRESRRDDAGNRYEPRRLASGERFEELDALWLVRYRAA